MLLKRSNIRFYVLLTLLLADISSFADSNASAKLASKGDKQFIKSHFQKALQFYQQAIQQDSTNAYAYFQTGAIYYLSDSSRIKSLPYFLNTIKNAGKGADDTIIDAYYYIGNCYTLTKNYPAAINAFNKYLSHVDQHSSVNATLLEEVRHDVQICNSAPTIINRNSDSTGYLLDGKMHPVYVKNIGGIVNSPYPEYAQVLLNHDSTIIFTSRRPASQKGKKDFMTDQYYEDIFVSHKDSGRWTPPTPFADQLHFSSGEINLASVTITSDGKTLYIYHKGRTLQSHMEGGKWTKPVPMAKNLGHIKHYVPSVFVSSDGKKMFLVSDREGGYGGKDIYLSQKDSSGKWGIPQNLGPEINTPFDEDSPFLLPDNKTLFFSSTGHSGLGGYDIFKTVYENGKWSTPVNLGAPINSSGDDIYLSYDTVAKEGYFSSSRVNTGYGDMDIYTFSFVCDDIKSTTLQGIVTSNGKNISGGTLSLTDTKSGKTLTAQTDASGKFFVTLMPQRTYSAVLTMTGFVPFNTTITTPHQCDIYNLYQYITPTYTDSANIHVGQALVVKNAFYRGKKNNGYKNANNDAGLLAYIKSFNDTATVWEKDTTVNITYTADQRNAINPKPVATDTTKMVTSAKVPPKPIVHFEFNKYMLEPQYTPMLDSIVAVMKTNSKYKIQLEGNTDTIGSANYNERLSLMRAKAVERYLISKGISANRIHLVGNGKRHLALPTDGANALNRRDDIIIIE